MRGSKGVARVSRSSAYAWPALIGVAALYFLNFAFDHSFVNVSEWGPLAASAAPFVLAAMAQVPAMLSGRGGIDLSVGPLMGLVNAVVMGAVVEHGATSAGSVVAAALAVGLAGGLLNGLLVAIVRVPPIIATLGTFFIFSALAHEVLPVAGGTAPGWLGNLSGSFGPLPGVLLFVVAITAIWLACSRASYVRNLLATGSDDRAAYTAGVRVTAVRIVAYSLGGLIAGAGGLALTVSLNSGDPDSGPAYTLYAIAGAALGGLSLAGGRGGMFGAAAGGSIFFLTQNLLTLVHLSVYALRIASGIIILVAVGLNSVGQYLGRRRAAAAQRLQVYIV